MNCNIQNTL